MFLRLYTGVTTWWNDLKGRAAEEGGATAVEYALMVADRPRDHRGGGLHWQVRQQPVQHRWKRGRRRKLTITYTQRPAPGRSVRPAKPSDELREPAEREAKR